MRKTVTLIVPTGTGGVRDYADLLAKGLRERGHDARLFAWSCENADGIDPHIAESDCIYLQYSGYGFSKRGVPLWMLHALDRKRARIRKFGVFFHELYAFGPPWSSAFWRSPLQRHVAIGLAKLCDFWVTNRRESWAWINKHAPNVPSTALPVPSNVGELSRFCPRRDRTIVVFGSAGLRRKTWIAAGERLFAWAARQNLELHDIGAPMQDRALEAMLVRHSVMQHGRLEANEVSRILAVALYGAVAYSTKHVAKSGVFSAYCAHGVAPVLLIPDHAAHHAPEAGIQYFTASLFESPFVPDPEAVGQKAWERYQHHSLSRHLRGLIEIESNTT